VLKAGEQFPKAITIDASGTIYANLATSTDALNGIVTIDTAGNLLTILPSTAQQFMWKDMKIGPGGDLFLVGPQRVLKQLPKGGAALVNYAPIPAADGVVSLNGLDFDASQNAWVGGEVTANKFYSITIPGKVVTSFTFDGIIKALRVYNGYLYIGAKAAGDADYKIFRFQINSSTSIGAKELYYDFGQKYPGKEINSMTFSSDGYLYVGILGASNGTNDMPGIVLISPAGAGSEDFYSGALVPASSINNSAAYSSLAWGIGKYLYAIRTRQYLVAGVATVDAKIVKINALKLGAPYYGR
jgi:hypothetical protein